MGAAEMQRGEKRRKMGRKEEREGEGGGANGQQTTVYSPPSS